MTSSISTPPATEITAIAANRSEENQAALRTINNSGTLTTADASVGSTLTAQRMQVAGVASLSATNIAGVLNVPTPTAAAGGRVALGSAAVPTTATSTSGFVQIAALPGTPVGQTASPAAGTVFLTFDTIKRAIAVNIAGSWFTIPSMELY